MRMLNPRLILLLDRWVGAPLCALLTPVAALDRVLRPQSGPPRKILFVKLIEMGSTVLAGAAFEEATRMVGRDNLYILVFAGNRPILDLLPVFSPHNIIVVDDRGPLRLVAGLLRAFVRIWRERIDTAIDLEGMTRTSALVTFLTGAAHRVGYHNFTCEGPFRGRLFTHELNYTFQRHVSLSFLALVRALKSPRGQVPMLKESLRDLRVSAPSFEPTIEERQQVRYALLARAEGIELRPKVILNPNCRDLLPLRKWPRERFVELGRRILAETDAAIIVTGSEDEREAAGRVAASIGDPGRAFSVAGCTTLRHLMALYYECDVLVSNDSGPCHFASMTPIGIVCLFGPETPLLYGPLGENVRAISAELACSPCVNLLNHRVSPCRDNRCMQMISVDEVLAATLDMLARSRGRSSERTP